MTGTCGQQHQDTKFRRVLPSYGYPVPCFEAGWMDQYRENWGLLRDGTMRGGQAA